MAQVDIAPTVLGLLGMDYRSSFYGADLFALEPGRGRAFIGNYQRLGYLRGDSLVELSPHRHVDDVRPDYEKDAAQLPLPVDAALARDAIAYYQTASYRFRHGMMANDASMAQVAPRAVDATRRAAVPRLAAGPAAVVAHPARAKP
jgi:hypothetical protein